MDPTGQYGAASYTAVPDLDARLLAMRLGDPSSARQQARYPALTPLLLPRDLAPTATPSVQPLLRLPPSPPQEFVTIADPSSSLRQARYPEPTPLLLPRDLVPTATPSVRPRLFLPPIPPREFVTTATPSMRPRLFLPPIPPREFVTTATSVERPPPENLPQPKPQVFVPTDVCLLQQLQVARQYWAPSQPQLLGCSAGESSVGTGCVSPLGSGSTFASLYGKHSQRFNAPAAAAPFLPKVPKPSKLSPSAEDFQPVPKPSNLNPSAEDFHPAPKPSKLSPSAEGLRAIPQSHHSMAQSSWTPSSSAGQCLPQLGAARTSSAELDNGSLDPYMSALLTAPRAKQDRSWGRAPASGRLPCLDVILARLLCASRKPASVTSDKLALAERVVCLLAEGGEEVRLKVLDAVKRAVHTIMGYREGHVVFLALLRACEGRFDELHGIVNAACTGDGSLMHAAKEFYGEKVLKELIRVVAPYPQLSQPLIICLLRERLMEHNKCAKLLRHCFTTLPYKDCSIIIRFAIVTIKEILSYATGSTSLIECFEHARNEELRALELFIPSNTHTLAKGESSNYFLQRVIECGSYQLQEGIAERIVHDIVDLSEHHIGSHVVEACIHLTCSLAPLLRVLNAFQDLDDDELSQLVQGSYSNYVVQKLLRAGKSHFPEKTMALARRIEALPVAVSRSFPASQVMRVANMLFPNRMNK